MNLYFQILMLLFLEVYMCQYEATHSNHVPRSDWGWGPNVFPIYFTHFYGLDMWALSFTKLKSCPCPCEVATPPPRPKGPRERKHLIADNPREAISVWGEALRVKSDRCCYPAIWCPSHRYWSATPFSPTPADGWCSFGTRWENWEDVCAANEKKKEARSRAGNRCDCEAEGDDLLWKKKRRCDHGMDKRWSRSWIMREV